jgi:hypothetical protein
MRILCIFRNNQLLDQSLMFSDSSAAQFKANTAFVKGIDVSELECVKFEDRDIYPYYYPNKHKPKKRIEITKTQLKLIDIVETEVEVQGPIYWQNCNDEQLEQYFTIEERTKIVENKEHLEQNGNTNYPHEISVPTTIMMGIERSEVVTKIINGIIIEG